MIKKIEPSGDVQLFDRDARNLGLQWETVMAWTETKKTRSLVARPVSIEECRSILEFACQHRRTICPRGTGHSYADVILNDGGIVLDTSKMNRVINWDRESGKLVVEPGVTFAKILRQVLPERWVLGACVGGMGVTVGGAVSNNVHGKDSWKVGNFGDQVVSVKLLIACGKVIEVDRTRDRELFRAVVAGMGLLGILVEITLQLRRIPSAFVEVTSIPVRNLDESLEILERMKESSDYVIAWVDAFAKGEKLGRGTVEAARWLEGGRDVDPLDLERSLIMPGRIFGLFPATLTWSVARPFFHPGMVKMANAVKYTREYWGGRRSTKLLFTDFNFMLNKIPGWKQLYRPYGYVELQPMLPRENGQGSLAEIINICHEEGAQSLLCAVKPHKSDDYFLSYEGDGYSIGIDIALRGRSGSSVQKWAKNLYTYVADCGGKAFLAKDEVLPRDIFDRMYPRCQEFLQVKQKVDPQNIFVSDLHRRLIA